jgi:2-hydroxychromene-2-carboxylate isomerase
VSNRSILRSILLKALLGTRVQSARRRFANLYRRCRGQRHVVSVFIELDDPYSYLLCHYLPCLAEHYDIELRLFLTQAVTDEYRPEPDLLARYAQGDCERLALELGVPFLDKGKTPPVEHRKGLINTLAADAGNPAYQEELTQAIEQYWRGDAEGVNRRVRNADQAVDGNSMLLANQKLLRKLGHYNTATMHYAGEWYWGVDRMHYLTERLDALGASNTSVSHPRLAAIRQTMQITLPVTPPAATQDLPELELFFSFRSPYSYLCLPSICAIADAFGLTLRIRPVLPMVMRGMQVPRPKQIYIMTDVNRVARRLQLPFGKFTDPVGVGVERCMAVFQYAVGEKREREFVQNAANAIWTQGVDVATDRGMRKVTGRTGLFWPDVKQAMEGDGWVSVAEENRASMMASGSWGVPTIRLGEFTVWGQDRDWLLVRHIEELCDTGDGILI